MKLYLLIVRIFGGWFIPDYTRGGNSKNPPLPRNLYKIKRIWNFFFGKKKVETKGYGCMPISVPPLESCDQSIDWIVKSKVIEHKEIALSKSRKMSFRKQQLTGKVYTIGKSRFRINKKIGLTASEKLRYEITQL